MYRTHVGFGGGGGCLISENEKHFSSRKKPIRYSQLRYTVLFNSVSAAPSQPKRTFRAEGRQEVNPVNFSTPETGLPHTELSTITLHLKGPKEDNVLPVFCSLTILSVQLSRLENLPQKFRPKKSNQSTRSWNYDRGSFVQHAPLINQLKYFIFEYGELAAVWHRRAWRKRIQRQMSWCQISSNPEFKHLH